MKRDLLTLWDLSPDEIYHLISRAREMKEQWSQGHLQPRLNGKTLGLLFVKPSTRTRVSFEVAMHRLGGQCIFLTTQDTQLSRGETLSDMARVMSRYIEALVIRTYSQKDVEELARYASIPIINGLTDLFHPYQVNKELLKAAPPHTIILHCLPAHREEEVTSEVLDGAQSVVFDQAENRLHLQMALLDWLLGN
jgi:ornithine carbamoyltransferase